MKRATLVVSTLLGALALPAGVALAADSSMSSQDQTSVSSDSQSNEQAYVNLMTPQERKEYNSKLNTAKNSQEREQVRQEFHDKMKQRAIQRGVTLPEDSSATGRGMDPSSNPNDNSAAPQSTP